MEVKKPKCVCPGCDSGTHENSGACNSVFGESDGWVLGLGPGGIQAPLATGPFCGLCHSAYPLYFKQSAPS